MRRLRRIARHCTRVARTRYPPFIFGMPLAHGDVPVFTFHDVTPQQLERDLEFLARNGYRTLGLDEFLHVASDASSSERRVLLTFDDARKSFVRVALPLLKAYGARAVLFAPTYWMRRRNDRRVEQEGDLFMSWGELRVAAASGCVDVESHAYRHALVFVSAQLADFASPAALAQFDIYDWPMRTTQAGDELGRPALGTPIYAAAPLLSARTRYIESASTAEACRQYVTAHGGADFFARPGWFKELRALHARQVRHSAGHYASASALRALQADEFEQSRAEFVRELGYAPRAFAYPWMLGSMDSLDLAKAHGIEAAFGVALDFRTARRRDLPIPVFGRYKCDWLRMLPGEQRESALGAFARKLIELRKLEHLAH